MNRRQRFYRKIIYIGVIAVLLLPLFWLSQPETTESKGGVLAQLRSQHQLSQAELGDIDPASETIKLAMLGMRGVAANILWLKANKCKKTEDWVGYSAALEQIKRLEPNVVSVWIHLGWNLTHNVSVEFDDYHDRYYWVIKGINYRQDGLKYNRDSPQLLSDIGWTIAQKIGRADEHLQFRRLFREDDDFNGSRPLSQRDNWLVGREWLLRAEQVAARGVAVRGERPVLFYSHPVMCLVNYSEDLEEEGTFGEVAKNAWKKAADAWTEFSNRDLPTPYNVFIRLSEKEFYDEKSKEAQKELARLAPPDLREKIAAERRAALSETEREALDTPPSERTKEQKAAMYAVHDKIQIGHMEIADRVSGENRAAALKAGQEAESADEMSRLINVERDIANYNYWLLRCQIEPNDDTLEARKLVYEGDQAFRAAQLVQSKELYVQGLEKWRKVLDAHPKLIDDSSMTDPLVESINRYRSVLHQLDEKFPDPFVLQNVLDVDAGYHGTPSSSSESSTEESAAPASDAAAPANEAAKPVP
jgi:hypothetical protein